MQAFTEMLEVDPNYAAGYFHGGQTLEKMGRTEEARSELERLLREHPDFDQAANARAELDRLKAK